MTAQHKRARFRRIVSNQVFLYGSNLQWIGGIEQRSDRWRWQTRPGETSGREQTDCRAAIGPLKHGLHSFGCERGLHSSSEAAESLNLSNCFRDRAVPPGHL